MKLLIRSRLVQYPGQALNTDFSALKSLAGGNGAGRWIRGQSYASLAFIESTEAGVTVVIKRTLLILSALLSQGLAAEAVLNFNAATRSCIAHAGSSWGYYGQLSQHKEGRRQNILLPNDWGLRYESCGRSLAPLHRQSPIELPAGDLLPQGEQAISFTVGSDTAVQIEHNCHTVQATLLEPKGHHLRLAGADYRLLQFHVHTPSEHVIDGGEGGTSNYPAEVHFVHAAVNTDGSVDSGRLAVIGVFIEVLDNVPVASVDQFFRTMAQDYQGVATTPGKPISVDIDQLNRSGEGYWRYQGSLTTPPCSETVEWIVLHQPLVISAETYASLQSAKLDVGFANSRPPALPTPHHQLRYKQE